MCPVCKTYAGREVVVEEIVEAPSVDSAPAEE
jgi:hypothetical protein